MIHHQPSAIAGRRKRQERRRRSLRNRPRGQVLSPAANAMRRASERLHVELRHQVGADALRRCGAKCQDRRRSSYTGQAVHETLETSCSRAVSPDKHGSPADRLARPFRYRPGGKGVILIAEISTAFRKASMKSTAPAFIARPRSKTPRRSGPRQHRDAALGQRLLDLAEAVHFACGRRAECSPAPRSDVLPETRRPMSR